MFVKAGKTAADQIAGVDPALWKEGVKLSNKTLIQWEEHRSKQLWAPVIFFNESALKVSSAQNRLN